MSPPDPLIALSGVTRVFGSGAAAFQALRGIDLTIDEGDFVAIMGPSGSGKSSLMNILGCLDTPSGGSYRFRGLAVETIQGNIPTVCHTALQASSMSDLNHDGRSITHCPYCHRLLVLPSKEA